MTITKRKKVEYAIPIIQSNITELSIYHGRINVNVVGDGGCSSGGAEEQRTSGGDLKFSVFGKVLIKEVDMVEPHQMPCQRMKLVR